MRGPGRSPVLEPGPDSSPRTLMHASMTASTDAVANHACAFARSASQPWGAGLPRGAVVVIWTPGHRRAFVDGVCEHAGTTRCDKLYIPAMHEAAALPLVLMLHGCNQSPEDFAAGTGMNARAGEQGFFVLYPEQAIASRGGTCSVHYRTDATFRGAYVLDQRFLALPMRALGSILNIRAPRITRFLS